MVLHRRHNYGHLWESKNDFKYKEVWFGVTVGPAECYHISSFWQVMTKEQGFNVNPCWAQLNNM